MTVTQQSRVAAAAATIIRTHQRRHPAERSCCCSWQPAPGGPGWSDHVADLLDRAGLLAADPDPARSPS